MNQRERLLIIGVLALIILAGGWFVIQNLVLAPLDARKATLAALEKDVQIRRDREAQIKAGLVKLERWRQLSLPSNVDLARRKYEEYLTELLRENNFAQGSSVTPRPVDTKSSPQLQGKGPVYTKLIFGIQGRATLENLVKMQEHFYRTGLLHQIKNLTIQRPLTTTPQQRPRELDITMTVEALIVAGAEDRQALLPLDKRLLAAEFRLARAELHHDVGQTVEQGRNIVQVFRPIPHVQRNESGLRVPRKHPVAGGDDGLFAGEFRSVETPIRVRA